MSALTYKNRASSALSWSSYVYIDIDTSRGAVSVATRVIAILSDGLVVVLTWMKTYRVHVLTRGVDFRTNYSTLILRDGTVYFLSVLISTFVESWRC